MIAHKRGNLFASDCQVLVNTVNCVGVMGKGVALEFRRRYPAMHDWYVDQCSAGALRPGTLLLWKSSNPWVLNFPTKDHWKRPARLEYIDNGLKELRRRYREFGIESIALPRLGTSSGELDWRQVCPLIDSHLGDLADLHVEVYEFDVAAPDQLFFRLQAACLSPWGEDTLGARGIGARQAKEITRAVRSNQITALAQVGAMPGIGQKTIDRLYRMLLETRPAQRQLPLGRFSSDDNSEKLQA